MQATSCASIRETGQSTFELVPRLWDKVQQNCPQEETHELKKIIGDSLIEESCDLYSEASTLLEIYQQMLAESDRFELAEHSNKLADPPEVRDRIVQEIVFLVDNLRLRSAQTGRLHSPVLENNKAVIDYATDRTQECKHRASRPCSADNRGSSSTPESISRASLSEVASDPDLVSVVAIDTSLDQIRAALIQECTDRKAYITRLQACIDEEIDSSSRKVPSLKELRLTTSQLEGELLSKPSSPSTKPRPPFQPAPQQRQTPRRASMPLKSQQPRLKLTESYKEQAPLLLTEH